MNNSLKNIRNSLKEKTNFTIFFPDPLNPHTQAIMDFKKKITNFHTALDNSQSIDVMKKYFLSLSNDFKNIQKLDGFNDDKNNIKSIYTVLSRKLNFEKPVNFFNGLVKNNYKNDFIEISEDEVNSIVQPILNKYNLAYFLPKDNTSNKEIIKFLNVFDNKAQAMLNDLGAETSILGIHGTLGLKHVSFGVGFHGLYDPAEKSISLNHLMGKDTILHEWVHAMDNYVAKTHLEYQNAGYVSSQEIAYIKEDTALSKAYTLLRSMTSELFSLNKKEAQAIIEEKEKEVLNKTWSILIGPEWYGLSDKQREPLFTAKTLNSINNYIINKNNTDTQIIAQAIEMTGILSQEKALKNIRSNDELLDKEILPILEDVQQNKKGKGSLYYYCSVFSDYTSPNRIFNFVKGKINGNSEQAVNSFETYYSQPEEMLARYFESQIYQKKILFDNLKLLVFLNFTGFSATSLLSPFIINLSMRMGKDSSFQKNKDELISLVFGNEALLPKPISQFDKLKEKIGNIIPSLHKPVNI